MNGKSNYKLKSLNINAIATIHTIFVNEKIIRIYSFHFQHETKDNYSF